MTVTITEARPQISNLIDRARAGDVVLICRHGRPVAKLVAEDLNDQPSFPDLSEFRSRQREKAMEDSTAILREDERF